MKEQLNELALFAGAGGGILGGHLLGWRTICAVEWEPYPASVLISRQNDGILPPFPVWDDVQTFDGKQWRGRVDVISGGFPCQDISCAGKGAGIDGDRSSMWGHMARIIGEVQPRSVFVENSPMLVGRGLARVLGDLAKMGYDAGWCVLGAVDAGAPHKRDRIWLVANSKEFGAGNECEDIRATSGEIDTPDDSSGNCGGDDRPENGKHVGNAHNNGGLPLRKADIRPEKQPTERAIAVNSGEEMADSDSQRLEELNLTTKPDHSRQSSGRSTPNRGDSWWATEPDVGRVAHGVAARVDRLKAIGNGQVPAVAALAWNTLNKI